MTLYSFCTKRSAPYYAENRKKSKMNVVSPEQEGAPGLTTRIPAVLIVVAPAGAILVLEQCAAQQKGMDNQGLEPWTSRRFGIASFLMLSGRYTT